MPRLVVLTAVHEPSAHHLPDAYRTLSEQQLPEGWDWQWVVQEDGQTGAVAPHLPEPDDPRVSFADGRRGGPGTARTIGLARAQGDLVRVLDSDDLLTPGALARDIAVFDRDPSIGWTTSRVLDALPDGSTAGFDGDPEEGPIERGAVHAFWKSHDYRAQVHPATLCVRRDLLMALGGWMALPASEDTGLLLALSATSRGYFTREVGLLYRKWEGQATAQQAHTSKEEREARMAVCDTRAQELAELGWTYPPTV